MTQELQREPERVLAAIAKLENYYNSNGMFTLREGGLYGEDPGAGFARIAPGESLRGGVYIGLSLPKAYDLALPGAENRSLRAQNTITSVFSKSLARMQVLVQELAKKDKVILPESPLQVKISSDIRDKTIYICVDPLLACPDQAIAALKIMERRWAMKRISQAVVGAGLGVDALRRSQQPEKSQHHIAALEAIAATIIGSKPALYPLTRAISDAAKGNELLSGDQSEEHQMRFTRNLTKQIQSGGIA